MSRPKPVVLLQYIDPKSYKAEQVLKSDAIFAVFFDGSPINLRSLQMVIDDTKYKKSSFANRGHAFNLKDKLNKMFRTDKFEVMMLREGTVIQEDNSDA